MMLTVPGMAKILTEKFGCALISEQAVRRAFDDLDLMGKITVERVGNKTRLVKESEKNLTVIADRLRETGAIASDLAAAS